ncbi:MAG: hypothetical protein IID41_00460 [Planctomycetes bacterium]|nr:hypothetical protein [Planctomycetota bacterium]
MDYWMVHVPGRTTTKMHELLFSAQEEARRIARTEWKKVNVLRVVNTFETPTPELYDWSIDQMLNLAMSRAKTSHRWTCIYAILNRLKNDGVTTLQAPQRSDGFLQVSQVQS